MSFGTAYPRYGPNSTDVRGYGNSNASSSVAGDLRRYSGETASVQPFGASRSHLDGAAPYSRGHSPTALGQPQPRSNATSLSQATLHKSSHLPLSSKGGAHSSPQQHAASNDRGALVRAGYVASDLARRVADLEERLRHIEVNEAEGMNLSHKTVRDTLATAQSLHDISASLEERILKDSRHLEEIMETKLRGEAEQRGDMEKHLKKILNDEATVLKETLLRSEGLQKDDIEVQLRHVTDLVNKSTAHMEDRIDDLKKEMAESVHVLQGTVDDVLKKLTAQKKSQNEAESNLLNLIEETCTSLQMEIEEERKQRVASHKHLERVLLEATARQWTKT